MSYATLSRNEYQEDVICSLVGFNDSYDFND